MTQSIYIAEEIQTTPSEQLLAYLFSPKAASSITTGHRCIHEGLYLSSPEELFFEGIDKTTVRKILALRELSHRMNFERRKNIKKVSSPQDTYNYLLDMRDLQQEQFRIILLNTKNVIIGQQMITQGTINQTAITPREVFHAAIKSLAAQIIIAHNHPSGDCFPSEEDTIVTKAIVYTGNVLGIPVLDHVIIGRDRYYSFKEEGIFPE